MSAITRLGPLPVSVISSGSGGRDESHFIAFSMMEGLCGHGVAAIMSGK